MSIKFIFHFLPLFLHDLQDLLPLTLLVSCIFTILSYLGSSLGFSVYWTIKKKKKLIVHPLSMTLGKPPFSYPRSTIFDYPQNFFYASCH